MPEARRLVERLPGLVGDRRLAVLVDGDRAVHHVHKGVGVVEVPAGVFHNCVEVTETTPLEPGDKSFKTYCPGVGNVRDDDLELIAVYENAESPAAKN